MSSSAASLPSPAAAGGAASPPQAPQAPQPPPPPPTLMIWQANKAQIVEDPARFQAINDLAQRIFKGRLPAEKLSFSISPYGGLELGFIRPDNKYQCQRLEPPSDQDLNSPDPQVQQEANEAEFLFKTAAFVTHVTPNAPAPPAPAPAAAAGPAAPAPAPAAPPAAAAGSAMQQQIADLTAAVTRLTNQPPAAAAPQWPPFAFPFAQPHHPPIAGAPQAAGAPQFHAQNPQLQGFLAGHLRNHVPRLQQIAAQLPQGQQEQLELNLLILQLNQNPQPMTLPELQAAQLNTQRLLYSYLQRQTTATNAIVPLQPQLAALNAPESNLLQGFLAAPQPAFNAAAAPELDTLLAAETLLQTTLRTYLTQIEIPPILAALQQNGIAAHPTLTAAIQEVPGASLTRLIAIDGELTASFKTTLNDVIVRLVQGSQNLNAPFAFAPIAPAAGAPAAGFANHTRAQLIQETQNIIQQYHVYIGQQINAAPQPAQIPPLAAFVAPAAPNLLQDLEAKPAEILNAFRNYLDTAISRQPAQVQNANVGGTALNAMPSATIAELQAKFNGLTDSLNIYLTRIVAAETRRRAPAANSTKNIQMTAMINAITNIAAAGPGNHPLQPLLAELQAALRPTFARLEQIKPPLEIFIEQQRRWIFKHPIAAAVGLAAIAALGAYFYSYGLSLGEAAGMGRWAVSRVSAAREALANPYIKNAAITLPIVGLLAYGAHRYGS